MKFTLVGNIGLDSIGELDIEKNEIIAVRQHYEASVITLKNGNVFRIRGIFRNLSDIRGY